MEKFEQLLKEWRSTLCPEIELAALYSRNPTAHKWKVTYRCIVLRELVAWRFVDLLSQAVELQKGESILGARIILRSALETLAILIYLNQKFEAVVSGKEPFNDFSNVTSRLMLGSKNSSTRHEAINILTVLGKCEKKYQGLVEAYENLSESAHPNWEGMCLGYSSIDEKNYITKFHNSWVTNFGRAQEPYMELFMRIFEHEYNEVWPRNFEVLEKWIEENDEELERNK